MNNRFLKSSFIQPKYFIRIHSEEAIGNILIRIFIFIMIRKSKRRFYQSLLRYFFKEFQLYYLIKFTSIMMNSESVVLPTAIHPQRTLISKSKYYKQVEIVISFKSDMAFRRSSLFDISTIFIDGFVLFSPAFFLKIFIKHSFC